MNARGIFWAVFLWGALALCETPPLMVKRLTEGKFPVLTFYRDLAKTVVGMEIALPEPILIHIPLDKNGLAQTHDIDKEFQYGVWIGNSKVSPNSLTFYPLDQLPEYVYQNFYGDIEIWESPWAPQSKLALLYLEHDSIALVRRNGRAIPLSGERILNDLADENLNCRSELRMLAVRTLKSRNG